MSEAWSILEGQRAISEQWGTDLGSGVHSAYSRWWRIEARRRRFSGQAESEIVAWQNSLDQARRGAAGWNRLGWDIAIIRALESLAEANSRNGQQQECVSARTEAATLRNRWHLPANDSSPLERSTFIGRLRTMLSFHRCPRLTHL